MDPDLYDALVKARGLVWDLRLYAMLASSIGGPVLELGCGTGRILGALLAAGHDAWGLELDRRIAEAARRRLIQRNLRDKLDRVTIGDMCTLAHPRRYRLIILPYNTLSQLHDTDSVRSMLRRVRAHLMPGGTFALDVYPAGGRPWSNPPYTFEAAPTELTVHGQRVVLHESGVYDPDTRMFALSQRGDWEDGRVQRAITRMHHLAIPQMERLLIDEGWELEGEPKDERGDRATEQSHIWMARWRLR